MSQLRKRTIQYKEPQRVKKLGYYPYFRELQSSQETEVVLNGEKVLMFGSNSYLGLTNHPQVVEATIKAVEKYGTGSGGSRFLNGTMDIHVELEDRLARFLGKEAVMVFSTGFHVNIGVIPTITDVDDFILCDRNNHASIIEGCRLSRAKTLFFKHNDMNSLEKKLQYCAYDTFKLIVIDGVFSMEGDIANLPEIVRLAKEYNATIMSDCAHGVGVLGREGRGTSSHFDLTDDVDLIGGTFSKSLASIGGFLASDSDTINFIKHHSRPFIFSASMTPASVASVLAALDILESDDSVLDSLWENTNYAKSMLLQYGFDIGETETPIIPIYVRDYDKTLRLSQKLLDNGIFVNTVVAPAVNSNDSLIRFSLMATHSKDQIEQAVSKIYDISGELNILEKVAIA